MRTLDYFSLSKALALAKQRGLRSLVRSTTLLMMGSSLMMGSAAWAAPQLAVFDGTTAIVANQPVDMLVTGAVPIAVASTSVKKTFTVKNTGTDVLNISSLNFSRDSLVNPTTTPTSLTGCNTNTVDPKFSQPALTSTAIAAGASTTFDLIFDLGCSTQIDTLPTSENPLQFLTLTGKVQIISNDGGVASSLMSFPVNGIIGTSGAVAPGPPIVQAAAADVRILDGTKEIQSCASPATAPCIAAAVGPPATLPNPTPYRTIDLGTVALGGTATPKKFIVKNIGNAVAVLAAVIPAPVPAAGLAPAGATPATAFKVTSFPANTQLESGKTTEFSVTLDTSIASTILLGNTVPTPFGATITVPNVGNANLFPASVAAPVALPNVTPDNGAPPLPTFAAGATYAVWDVAPLGATFGVIGTVTPLPVADVQEGTTAVADDTGVVDFGTLLKGDAVKNIKTFTVRNLGGKQLTLTNPLAINNTSGSGFSLVTANFPKTTLAAVVPVPPAAPVTIDSTTFQVKLDTSVLGAFEGEVSFTSDDPKRTPYNFKVKGAVVGSALQEIEVWWGTPAEVAAGTAKPITDGTPTTAGTEIDFSTPLGTDVTKTFTIRNTGGTLLNTSYLSDPLPAGFGLASSFPSLVQPGNVASFAIKLSAATAGVYGGELSIFNDDKANVGDTDGEENPFNFRVKATVKAPAPEIQVIDDAGTDIDITVPTKIDFGKKPQGTNVPKVFTVKNIGDAVLSLKSAVTVTGTGFTVTSFNPGPVAAGATANFTVTLDATNAGTFNGQVSFTNDDSDEGTFTFPVTAIVEKVAPVNQAIEVWYGKPADIIAGTAIPITDGTATNSGTAIDMGNFDVGASAVKTFTIRNIGSKDLSIFGIPGINGVTAGTYPPKLIAGGEATFDVTVDTSAATTGKPPKGGIFQIFNDDPGKTPFDFPLTATVGTQSSQQAKLTVTVKGNGSVDSTFPVGLGITNCTLAGGTSCEAVLPSGTTAVTLTAKGGTVTWSGSDCKVGAKPETATVSVTSTATIVSCTADFTSSSTEIPLTVKVTGTGTGTVESILPANVGITACAATSITCTGKIPAGTTSVSLKATPADTTTAVSWGPGCTAGTEPNTGTIAITSAVTSAECTVAFTLGTTPTGDIPLTVKVVGSGSVDSVIPNTLGIANCAASGGATCTAKIPTGTKTVVLTAKPVSGETVTWGPGCDGTGYTGVVNVTAGVPAIECTATFKGSSTGTNLTVTVVGNGSITSTPTGITCTSAKEPTCTAKFQAGDVTLTATPTNAADTVAWSNGCTDMGNKTGKVTMVPATAATCTATIGGVTPPTTKAELNVTVSGNGSVIKTPVGEACATPSANCSSYATGTPVTLTANPTATNTIFTWGGDCGSAGAGNSAQVTMNVAKNCTATFTTTTIPPPPPSSPQLTVTVSGSGTVTSDSGGINCGTVCSASYTSGSLVRLTATPSAGATFTSWGGSCTGTSASTMVSMDAAKSCTATFSGSGSTGGKAELNVNMSGNGTVTKTPAGEACATPSANCSSYATGTPVTLTANSTATNTTFTGWGGDCSSAGAGNPAQVTMSVAKNCTATFITSTTPPPPPSSPQLTVTVSGSGTVTSDSGGIDCGTVCSASYTSGSLVRLTATPSAGATFTTWGGSCTGTSASTVVSMDATKSCTATFSSGGSTGGVVDPNVANCFNQNSGIYAGSACLTADKLLPGAVDANGNGVNVTVSMKGGISKSNGPYLKESTVVLADPIATRGVIQVDPADVGKKVDLIVAGIHYSTMYPRGFEWYMLDGCNTCVAVLAYNDRDAVPMLSELKALKTVDALPSILVVDMYSGNFVFPGFLDIFYGYRVVGSGKIVFNLDPIKVTINP